MAITTYTTEVLGLGESPLGTTALGVGYEEVTETVSSESGVRYIDPVTRDYATRNGEVLRAGSARQIIVLLLTTEVRTSLAIKGISMPPKHDDSTARAVESEVRRVVQPLINDGLITLQRITAQTRADNVVGRLGVSVEYIDRETGEEEIINA